MNHAALAVRTERRFMERFWMCPMSGCWIWMGYCDKDGYGSISIKHRPLQSHRFSWILFKGNIPDGMSVLHRCDVPACVNPAHLFLGTIADNMRDRDRKSRQARGERINNSKLTASEVLKIREDWRSAKVVAADYGIGKSEVQYIRARAVWRWLPERDQ